MDSEGVYEYRVPVGTFLDLGLDWAVEAATRDLVRNPDFRSKVAEPNHWPFSYQFRIETGDNQRWMIGEGEGAGSIEEIRRGRDVYVDVLVHYPLSWTHGLVTEQ